MAIGIQRSASLLVPRLAFAHTTATLDRRARIAALESELATLRRQQDDDFIVTIAPIVQRRAFSSAELFDHATVSIELRDMFAADGIRSARHLGKRLQRLHGAAHGGWRLARVGHDDQGVIWSLYPDADSDPAPSG